MTRLQAYKIAMRAIGEMRSRYKSRGKRWECEQAREFFAWDPAIELTGLSAPTQQLVQEVARYDGRKES